MAVDVREELSKPFGPRQIRQLKKGGTSLDYVPIAEVIARLNAVLGTENWGEEDATVQRDPSNPDWIVAKAVVWAEVDGKRTVKIGYGGQKIKEMKSGGPVDLGDEFKGAHSDAFKKAVTKLGVGLHLARDESAIFQEIHDSEVRARKDSPLASEEVKTLLTEAIIALEEPERDAIKAKFQREEIASLKGDEFTEAHAKIVAAWLDVELPDA